MSVSGEPTPDELVTRFGITPAEANAVAEAFAPVQTISGAAAGVGSAMEGAPGTGPKFLGALVQNFATQVELISSSAETIARAIEFYILAQRNGISELFPPPSMVAGQLADDLEPLIELALVRDTP
jgi:hypothetical protein